MTLYTVHSTIIYTELAVDSGLQFQLLLVDIKLDNNYRRVFIARTFHLIIQTLVIRVVRSARENRQTRYVSVYCMPQGHFMLGT